MSGGFTLMREDEAYTRMSPGMPEAVGKRKVVAGAGLALPLPGCSRFSPLHRISPPVEPPRRNGMNRFFRPPTDPWNVFFPTGSLD